MAEAQYVELLNKAHMCMDANEKVNILGGVRELVFEREPSLLPRAVQDMIAFQTDKSSAVHRLVLLFLETAVTRDAIYFKALFDLCTFLLSNDPAPSILRRCSVTLRRLIRPALSHINHSSNGSNVQQNTDLWKSIEACILSCKGFVDTSLLGEEPQLLRALYSIKLLEWVVLTFVEASDHEYRDPARSNCDPDDMNVAHIAPNHPVFRKNTVLNLGEDLVTHFCTQLGKSKTAPLRFSSVLINSISLITSLRPGIVNATVPNLLALEESTRTEGKEAKSMAHVIRLTLRGNLLRLLRLPILRNHADNVTEALELLDAAQQAQTARSKAREPRRKYVATPLQHIRGAVGKRAAEKLQRYSTPSKRLRHGAASTGSKGSAARLTPEVIETMDLGQLVDIVMQSMKDFPTQKAIQTKKNLTELLQQLGTAGSSKSRRLKAVLTAAQLKQVVGRMEHTLKQGPAGAIAVPKTKKPAIPTVLEIDDENSVIIKPLPPMGEDTCRKLALVSVQRILEGERGAKLAGKSFLREQILSRLSCNRWLNEKENIYELILKYVEEKYQKRTSLAMAVVYQEYVRGLKGKSSLFNDFTGEFFKRLLAKMDPSTPSDRTLFRDTIAQLPVMPPSVLKLLNQELFSEKKGIVLGITTLRDLIFTRSSCRNECFALLLHYTAHSDPVFRNPTIRCIANQLYTHDNLAEPIEQFALKSLSKLIVNQDAMETTETFVLSIQETEEMEYPEALAKLSTRFEPMQESEKKELATYVSSVMETETTTTTEARTEGEEETEDQVVRYLEFYLALCAKKLSLFQQLIITYGSGSELTQETIFQSIEKLVIHLKQKEGEDQVVKQLYNFPPPALPLVCHVIDILCQQMRPSDVLVESVLKLHESSNEMALIIPVLSGITRAALQPLLPSLLLLPPHQMEQAFNKLLRVVPPPVDAGSLLLDLHHVDIEKDQELQKGVVKAVTLCTERPRLFTMEVFGVVTNELVEETPIPKLTLRTMIVAVTLYPRLKRIMINLLSKLVQKKIWAMGDVALWTGFRKCVQFLQPQSFMALLEMPLDQIHQLFQQEDSLKEPFIEYVSLMDAEAVPPTIKEAFLPAKPQE